MNRLEVFRQEHAEINRVYYRIYQNRNNQMTVVCLQWFDEYNYDQTRFGTSEKFDTEELAVTYLNQHYSRNDISPEYFRVQEINL